MLKITMNSAIKSNTATYFSVTSYFAKWWGKVLSQSALKSFFLWNSGFDVRPSTVNLCVDLKEYFLLCPFFLLAAVGSLLCHSYLSCDFLNTQWLIKMAGRSTLSKIGKNDCFLKTGVNYVQRCVYWWTISEYREFKSAYKSFNKIHPL